MPQVRKREAASATLGEDWVAARIHNRRRLSRDVMQCWHPSILASYTINALMFLANWYRLNCYWTTLVLFGLTKDFSQAFRRGRRFHLLRRLLLGLFFLVVCSQYIWRSTRSFPAQACYDASVVLFLTLLVDSVLYQWADLLTFFRVRNMSAVSLLLLHRGTRDTLYVFRDHAHEMANKDFRERLEEHFEELQNNRSRIERSVFPLALLPMRHIFRFIALWALMVLSLQITWQGRAFSHLQLEGVRKPSISAFVSDLSECVYFASSSTATIGYGDVASAVADDKDVSRNFNNVFPSTKYVRVVTTFAIWVLLLTIFSTLNLAYRSVDELLSFLRDRDRMKKALEEFVTTGSACPLIS
jgi:hypothetical protein